MKLVVDNAPVSRHRPSTARRRIRRLTWMAVMVIAILGTASGPVLGSFLVDGARFQPLVEENSGCRVTSVTDGDTVRMRCPGRAEERVRLTGFDTPELFSPGCRAEHRAAIQAKTALQDRIRAADTLDITRRGTDRYGRTLAELRLDGQSVARLMIADGHARAYAGGTRASWC